jgi:hypothetical protein
MFCKGHARGRVCAVTLLGIYLMPNRAANQFRTSHFATFLGIGNPF